MNRPVIVIATAIIIVIAGLIIYERWEAESDEVTTGPPSGSHWTATIDDNALKVDRTQEPKIAKPDPSTESGTEPKTVPVSINAIPWARVLIKPPGYDSFIELRPQQDFTITPDPNEKEPDVTPIPGDLKVPSGTAIKLMYRGREKIFRYDEWKDRKTISYDFLNH